MADQNQKLADQFNVYVGAIIKDPQRFTADMDTEEGVALSNLAQQNGLSMLFIKPSSPPFSMMPDVTVNITQEGVPADKSWGWRVQSIDIA